MTLTGTLAPGMSARVVAIVTIAVSRYSWVRCECSAKLFLGLRQNRARARRIGSPSNARGHGIVIRCDDCGQYCEVTNHA